MEDHMPPFSRVLKIFAVVGGCGGEALLSSSAPPSWSELERALPSLQTEPLPTIDAAIESTPSRLDGVVLYRERNGWCPYSERAWLALETTGVSYTTILIDNTGGGRPAWFSGTTPRIRWDDGSEQGESMDIVRGIDERLGDGSLYAPPDVERKISAFRDTFPRMTRPSSRSAFLFRTDGSPVFRRDFEKTLEATNALLGEGPFFCGRDLSAADIAWAPFLERYAAQLPLLHPGLRPRDDRKYPNLSRWFDAMETRCPPYYARIRGDDESWAKVLKQAGFGNAGVAPPAADSSEELPRKKRDPDLESVLWRAYGWDRDGIGRTPSREAATRIVRNKEAIVADAARTTSSRPEDVDDGLRRCVAYLINDEHTLDADDESAILAAKYLSERLCVPRDMGAPPAAAIRHLLRQNP